VPLTLLKAPRTVEMARCRTENCAALCCGSIFHSVVAAKPGTEMNSVKAAMAVIEMLLAAGFFICVVLSLASFYFESFCFDLFGALPGNSQFAF
jgi:uncharacterized membrane protein